MAADVLVMQGARASATMNDIDIVKLEIIQSPHIKG